MKILLHICCGPCSLYVIDHLRNMFGKETEIVGLYFNPNIHPLDEFERRKNSTIEACKAKDIDLVIFDDYDIDTWDNFNGEKDDRCKMCYNIRLEGAGVFAFDNDFTYFTTTLLVSPYQNHEAINEVGRRIASENGIEFLDIDFSIGFRKGQNEARELGLYRQKYCGCIKSLEDR